MADKHEKEIDEITGTETTQHEWDGIKELNTPLPSWWLWTFYATVIWAIGYTIFYPAWPMLTEATAGVLGYTNRGALIEKMEAAEAEQKPYLDRIAALEITEIPGDQELMRFARAGGEAVFANNCSQCHGAGAAGVQAAGYPNLLDDAWLWGGTLEAIQYTVAHGIRNEDDPDARFSQMPAFGADGILSEEEIGTVADYVLALSGDGETTAAGAEIYEIQCAACHGPEGKGMEMLGAPNLTDAIWLYGGERERVIESIAYSRYGVMPPWNREIRGSSGLTEAEIKQVSLYVHGLGGGQ